MRAIGRRESTLNLYFSGRIEGLSVYHHALMAFAGWFFIFTVIDDTYQIGSLFFEYDAFWRLMIGILFNVIFLSGFFVFPCAFAGWGVYKVKNYDLRLVGKFSRLKFLSTIFVWIYSGFIFVLCPLAVFVLLDMWIVNSVMPLTTVICSILWLIFGISVTRFLRLNRRIIIVISMLLLILSVKYMDWSPKKSFVRDLLQIRRGMTGVQVEKIMRNQQKNFVQPESDHFLHLNPEYTGETAFRDNGGDSIAVFSFQEGRVVNVIFDND